MLEWNILCHLNNKSQNMLIQLLNKGMNKIKKGN